MLWSCLRLWCVVGLLGVTYEMKSVSVMEGDSVTLHTDREMRNDDLIKWRFGPDNTLITEISVADSRVIVHDDYDERFRGRTQVDYQTGCLTITSTTTEHAGHYQLQTNREKKLYVLIVHGVTGDEGQMKSVMEGDSVILHADTEMRNDGEMEWSFGNSLLARTADSAVFDDILDGRFRDRLKVDDQTGSLTISNTTTKHTGSYHLQTNQRRKIFILTVYAPLPVPVIFSYCPPSPPSSESIRVLLCSVLNVSHVTLSWYKGNSLLSSISVSDLSISLSLPLEVGYQDTNTYSCVLNNSFTDRTQHLDLSQFSRTCSVSARACDSVEAVMRLVVSALVGVAAAAAAVVLLYDIRSRRAQQDQTPVL